MYALDAWEGHEQGEPPLRIAVLLNDPEEYTGSLAASYLEQAGAEVHRFRAYRGEVPDPDAFDGYVGSGSPLNVREHRDDPWLQAEEELYRATERPTLAICFGHQLLAESYGGLSDKAAGYDVSKGPNRVRLDPSCPLFKGLPAEVVVSEHHGDEVVRVPEGFEVTASSDVCRVEGMGHRRKPIYSVQFHPEWAEPLEDEGLANRDGYRVLENFLGIAREARERREARGLRRLGYAVADWWRDAFGEG